MGDIILKGKNLKLRVGGRWVVMMGGAFLFFWCRVFFFFFFLSIVPRPLFSSSSSIFKRFINHILHITFDLWLEKGRFAFTTSFITYIKHVRIIHITSLTFLTPLLFLARGIITPPHQPNHPIQLSYNSQTFSYLFQLK